MQGLLLCSSNKIPQKFGQFKLIWQNYHAWLKRHDLTVLEANINFVNQNKKISNFLVGVEDIKQLLEIINVKRKNIKHANVLSTINKDIIDPRLWSRK